MKLPFVLVLKASFKKPRQVTGLFRYYRAGMSHAVLIVHVSNAMFPLAVVAILLTPS